MKEEYLHYPANYFTATINEWKPVLANDNYKDIIIGSLQNLVSKNRIELNAFVIMYNHIHLIWQALQSFTPIQNQASFMKFTASIICMIIPVRASGTYVTAQSTVESVY